MSLPKEAIEEFKELYKEHYEEELSDFVASDAANRLVNLVNIVYRPITKEQLEEFDKTHKDEIKVPEKNKKDLVRHLVKDAEYTEFKIRLTEGKSKKEANDLLRQLTTSGYDIDLIISFLTENKPKIMKLLKINKNNLNPNQLVKILNEFNFLEKSIKIPERTTLAINNLRNLLSAIKNY